MALDAIIDATLADEVEALREMVRYTTTGCTHQSGLGGPPKCAPEQQEGTLVEVLPLLGSEGTFARRDGIESVFPLGVKQLYAVFRVPDEATGTVPSPTLTPCPPHPLER